ncbi:MAG: hypothetical protein IJL17_18650 [Kiritimatiellae bacterium]|nr:hypothetical protein [Kiritimatiellia bacterium]
MNRMHIYLICLMVVGLLAPSWGEVPDPAVRELTKEEVMALPKESRQEYMRKLIFIKTGGSVIKPDTGKGAVRVVIAAQGIPLDIMDEPFANMTKIVKIDVKTVQGTKPMLVNAKGELKKYAAQAGVYVVEDDTLPRMLVAPEEGWAFVNVKALRDGNVPEDHLTARARKEISRALMFVCGCGNAGAVMQSVTSLVHLDRIPVDTFPPMARNQIIAHLNNLGVEPIHQASYLRACQEGWAPAPTNDIQRGIWQKVRADKERGPTNPILIPPPKAKK